MNPECKYLFLISLFSFFVCFCITNRLLLSGIDRQMSCMLTSFGALAVDPRRGATALGRHQEANILISLLTKPLSAKGERKLT